MARTLGTPPIPPRPPRPPRPSPPAPPYGDITGRAGTTAVVT